MDDIDFRTIYDSYFNLSAVLNNSFEFASLVSNCVNNKVPKTDKYYSCDIL